MDAHFGVLAVVVGQLEGKLRMVPVVAFVEGVATGCCLGAAFHDEVVGVAEAEVTDLVLDFVIPVTPGGLLVGDRVLHL